MINLIYDRDINIDNVAEFVDEIAQLPLEETETINLYFQSNGGEVCLIEYFVNTLNTLADKHDLTIYTGNEIFSAALKILLDFKGKVVISPLTLFMTHEAYITHSSSEVKNTKSIVHIINNNMREVDKEYLELLPLVFSDRQVKDYKLGKEIYFFKQDFLKLKEYYDQKNSRKVSNEGVKIGRSQVKRKPKRGTKGS